MTKLVSAAKRKSGRRMPGAGGLAATLIPGTKAVKKKIVPPVGSIEYPGTHPGFGCYQELVETL